MGIKVHYSRLGKDTFAAEYCDYGAIPARFGKRPQIEINLDLCTHSLSIAEALGHELFHYFTRILPIWLELLLDNCIDITEGRHLYTYHMMFKRV